MKINYTREHLWLIEYLASENEAATDARSFIGVDIARQKSVAKKLASYGLTALSATLVARAIRDLGLDRFYDPAEDAATTADEALRRADVAPLTREIGERLTQMSPNEVATKFYADPSFKRLYTRAAALWGFKIPGEPSKPAPQGPAPVQTLTAQEYHSTPTAIIIQKYRSDAAFRAQVDGLIAKGLI